MYLRGAFSWSYDDRREAELTRQQHV